MLYSLTQTIRCDFIVIFAQVQSSGQCKFFFFLCFKGKNTGDCVNNIDTNSVIRLHDDWLCPPLVLRPVLLSFLESILASMCACALSLFLNDVIIWKHGFSYRTCMTLCDYWIWRSWSTGAFLFLMGSWSKPYCDIVLKIGHFTWEVSGVCWYYYVLNCFIITPIQIDHQWVTISIADFSMSILFFGYIALSSR